MAYYKQKRKSISDWKSWEDKQPSGERGISRSIIADWQSSEEKLQSTITNQSAEVLRLRELLKDLRRDSQYWLTVAIILQPNKGVMPIVETTQYDTHNALVEKLKQEGVE
jgi:hypothetical protein